MSDAPPRGSAVPFAHAPILLAQTVALARVHGCRRLVDCTVGGAGHSVALLEALPQAKLLALDRDPDAVAVARARLTPFGTRAKVVHAPFSALADALAEAPFAGEGVEHGETGEAHRPDFLLADFGVSSHQLDTPGRGFSFRLDGPLDMRMDPSRGQSAAELIAESTPEALADLIYRFGEERQSRRIARALCAAAPKTTLRAAEVVRGQLPRPRPGTRRIDPATRTFQALRVAVNDELGEIEALLAAVPAVLADGGVAAALSFHSLEDRLLKHALRAFAYPCVCPPQLPLCACGRRATMRLEAAAGVLPDADEVAANPRARSARLRWAVRLPRTLDAPADGPVR